MDSSDQNADAMTRAIAKKLFEKLEQSLKQQPEVWEFYEALGVPALFNWAINGVDWVDSRPEWVQGIALKLLLIFFGRPPAKEVSEKPVEYARLAGRTLAALNSFKSMPQDYLEIFPPKTLQLFESKGRAFIAEKLAALNHLPNSEAAQAAEAFSEGLSAISPQGEFAGMNHRLIVDVTLLLRWREIEKMPNAKVLYDWIASAAPSNLDMLGDYESFHRYVRDLGLHLGKPGRPKKNPEQPENSSS